MLRKDRIARWIPVLCLALGAACTRGPGCQARERYAGGSREAARDGAPAAVLRNAPPRVSEVHPEQPAAEFSGQVVRVRDGDSLVVLSGGAQVEVRLDGIDSPELVQTWGRKARSCTSNLALRREVHLVVKGRDKYNRDLAEVFLPDGRSLNRELVAAGCAWWFRRFSSDRSLELLELEARSARRGLWANPHPVPPWDFRDRR